MKLPDKEARSLSFLAFSLACLFLANDTTDSTTRIVLWVLASISFVLAAIKFIKTNFSLPLVPCKSRLRKNDGFIFDRYKVFYLGFFISILAINIIRKYQIDFPLKDHSLLIGIICTLSTIVHGVLRRCFSFLRSDNFFNNLLTTIVGFITGIGVLFVAIYFIYF